MARPTDEAAQPPATDETTRPLATDETARPTAIATATAPPDLPPFDPRVWENHNSVVVGILVLAALYLWAVGPLRRRYGWAAKFPKGRAAVFFTGLVILFGALNGPIHDLSDYYLFSVHMVQHLLLTEIWAPLFLLGIPTWLVAAIVRRPALGRLARALGHPVVAGGLLSASIALWHTVPFYQLMMANHDVHIATHILFMVTAVIAWWPVCCPAVEFGALRAPAKMLYLFVLGIPMTLVASIISLAKTVLYPWYSTAPRVGGLTPIADQQLGGLIMWVPGGLVLWIAITVVWFQWSAEESRAERLRAGERAEHAGAVPPPFPASTIPR